MEVLGASIVSILGPESGSSSGPASSGGSLGSTKSLQSARKRKWSGRSGMAGPSVVFPYKPVGRVFALVGLGERRVEVRRDDEIVGDPPDDVVELPVDRVEALIDGSKRAVAGPSARVGFG